MSKVYKHKGHEYHRYNDDKYNLEPYPELIYKCSKCEICVKIDHLDNVYEFVEPNYVLWVDCTSKTVPSCGEIMMTEALE